MRKECMVRMHWHTLTKKGGFQTNRLVDTRWKESYFLECFRFLAVALAALDLCGKCAQKIKRYFVCWRFLFSLYLYNYSRLVYHILFLFSIHLFIFFGIEYHFSKALFDWKKKNSNSVLSQEEKKIKSPLAI